MNIQRLGVAVGVINGQLYAVGGSNGTCPLNTVERFLLLPPSLPFSPFTKANESLFCVCRYDPRENKWTYIAPMQVKRKHLGVAVSNGCLYSVGGRDESYELSSVERYGKFKRLFVSLLFPDLFLIYNSYNLPLPRSPPRPL